MLFTMKREYTEIIIKYLFCSFIKNMLIKLSCKMTDVRFELCRTKVKFQPLRRKHWIFVIKRAVLHLQLQLDSSKIFGIFAYFRYHSVIFFYFQKMKKVSSYRSCPPGFWVVIVQWETPVPAGIALTPSCTNQEPLGRCIPSTRDRNHTKLWAPHLSARPSRFGCIWLAQSEDGQIWTGRQKHVKGQVLRLGSRFDTFTLTI